MKTNKELQEILQSGGIIAYPTDTIWGIGCDATNDEAVEKVFALKQRPKEKSLIVLMSSMQMLEEHGVVLTDTQKKFLEDSWKPTTIILDGVIGLAPSVYHADGSVGVRIVSIYEGNEGADWCHEFLEQYGKPLVSTSANIAGEPTARIFAEIVPEIVQGVDGYPDPAIAKLPGEPSQIVRIDTNGEVAIVRP